MTAVVVFLRLLGATVASLSSSYDGILQGPGSMW